MKTWTKVVAALAALLCAACTPFRSVEQGGILTAGDGHTGTVIGADGITHSAVDGTAHYAVFDSDGVEVFSPLAAGASFLGANGIAISSPKDTAFQSARITFDQAGAVTSIEVDGFNTEITAAITADAAAVSALADYAEQLSADQRDAFIGAIEAVSPVASSALRALFPVP